MRTPIFEEELLKDAVLQSLDLEGNKTRRELARHIGALAFTSLSPGALYPILRQLWKERKIGISGKGEKPRKSRKTYHLLPAGAAALQRHVLLLVRFGFVRESLLDQRPMASKLEATAFYRSIRAKKRHHKKRRKR